MIVVEAREAMRRCDDLKRPFGSWRKSGARDNGKDNSDWRNKHWPEPKPWKDRTAAEKAVLDERRKEIMAELGKDIPVRPMG